MLRKIASIEAVMRLRLGMAAGTATIPAYRQPKNAEMKSNPGGNSKIARSSGGAKVCNSAAIALVLVERSIGQGRFLLAVPAKKLKTSYLPSAGRGATAQQINQALVSGRLMAEGCLTLSLRKYDQSRSKLRSKDGGNCFM